MPQQFKEFPFKKVFGFRGMVISSTEIFEDDKTITIRLNRDKRRKKSCCSQCGHIAPREFKARKTIRDLPMCGYDILLDCEIWAVKCPACNRRVREKLDFVDKCSRITVRFETFIYELVSMSTVIDVSNKYHLSWDTVKNIDKKYLETRFADIDYGELEYLSIDEIAIKKGHNYLSIVMNLKTGRVIWTGEGRKEEDINKFFATLTDEQKQGIEAVSIDMWPAYINSAARNCPDADIVFDKFHVVKKFSEIITKLRAAEYNKAADEKSKEVLKGTKWLLLKNKSNLKTEAKKELKQLLELNKNLATAYILKEDLAHIWNYKNKTWCKKKIDSWVAMADSTGIRGIKAFVKMLKKHEYGILNHCNYQINNGKIEGTNNKIKTLKRRSYGFHDVEYFKLKILQTCQGKEKV